MGAFLLLSLHVVSFAANVVDDPVLSADEKSAGFELLFNGKDLSGWEHNGKPGTFDVKDGLMRGWRQKETAYWIGTKDEYGDFELRLEYRIPPKGNSGVFIRAPRGGGRTSQLGMEIQIYDEGDKTTPHKGSTGSIYNVVPPKKFAHKPPGEWNSLWILCDEDHVKITINGEVVNDALMSDYKELKDRPRKGFIGLSAHTDAVEYRNIRLRVIR